MSSETGKRPYGTGDASFQAAGGYDGIKLLVDDFYRAMDELPQAAPIRAMYPDDLTEAADKLTRFLCGWLGGPKLFSEKYGPIAIPAFHRQFPIDAARRDAWLDCMRAAAEKQPFAEDFRQYLLAQLYVPAERSRNLP
ncbi:group II truncated hemoglobin [Thalassolituus sp. LLYu03]|uniref:group II truncated hemoglobin n=1 Tax=Thalassolituus sp. LLYu03 TaxID=3421656 RepID=UPI003D270E92